MKKYNLSDIILCLKKRDIDMIINRMVLVEELGKYIDKNKKIDIKIWNECVNKALIAKKDFWKGVKRNIK